MIWYMFLFFFFGGGLSAKSRVRGTLEIYHAFIRDLDASDSSSSTNLEPDWEVVNDAEQEQEADMVIDNIPLRLLPSQFLIEHVIFACVSIPMLDHQELNHCRLDGKNVKMPMAERITSIMSLEPRSGRDLRRKPTPIYWIQHD